MENAPMMVVISAILGTLVMDAHTTYPNCFILQSHSSQHNLIRIYLFHHFMFEDITKMGKQMIINIVKIVGLFAVIIYVVSPVDLLPLNPMDDIAVIFAYLSFVGIDIFRFKKKE